MKHWIAALLAAVLGLWQSAAQAEDPPFSQAELDALLAPIALYPDPVLTHILVAATRPEDLRQAAAWSRANAHLSGEAAVRAADAMPWHPSVKALLAFPDLLARMDESPRWTADLATAFLEQEPYVMDTVQALRRRAQASGYLQDTPQQQVYEQDGALAIYPAQPHVVYVPYYDPYVVYGPWWWPADRPVYWRPWYPRHTVFVSTHFFASSVDWHRRHIVRHGFHHRPHHHRFPADHGHFRKHRQHAAPVTIHNHARPVRPIVDSVRIRAHPPAQVHRPEVRREFHRERRGDASHSFRAPNPAFKIQHHAQPPRPIAESRPFAQVRREFRQSHPGRPIAQARPQMRQSHGGGQRRGGRDRSR